MSLPACSPAPARPNGTRTIAACPASPNCVSSDATDSRHAIAPLPLTPMSWPQLRAAIAALPRTTIVTERPEYLHAKCRSLLGFVDDLELELRPNEKVIAVRSAARTGYYDFGVNRRRIEKLREELAK